MSKETTPGPWRVKRLGSYTDPGHVLLWPDKGGAHWRRVDYQGNFTEADALRIVACVNACQGIQHYVFEDVPYLEIEGGVAAMIDDMDDLVTMVRRLVRALNQAAPKHALVSSAMDYLERKGFNNGPFRDAAAATPE